MNTASHEGCRGTFPMYKPIRLHYRDVESVSQSRRQELRDVEYVSQTRHQKLRDIEYISKTRQENIYISTRDAST